MAGSGGVKPFKALSTPARMVMGRLGSGGGSEDEMAAVAGAVELVPPVAAMAFPEDPASPAETPAQPARAVAAALLPARTKAKAVPPTSPATTLRAMKGINPRASA